MTDSLDTPLVSIIVPTFRRPRVLKETLIALLGLDYPRDRYEIIVIDDGSGDETPEVVAELRRERPRFAYHVQENRGVATARNQGAKMATGEVLIFIDDDIIVPPDLIKQHLVTLAEFGDCLVNGHWEFAPELSASLRETSFGRFRIEVEQWVKTGLIKSPLKGNWVEPSGATACNLAIRREHYWDIGGFDEHFPFAGYEDQEFSLRARSAGYRLIYNYDLRFWHNDHRLTLNQFCARLRRGAVTAALLAIKHPKEYYDRPLIVENRSIRRSDSPALILKKLGKTVLGTRAGLMILHRVVGTLELIAPRSQSLRRLYWAMCGLYICQGIREGLNRYGRGELAAELRSSVGIAGSTE